MPSLFWKRITSQHINAIQKFLIKYKEEHFTIRMIQQYLIKEYSELAKISDWSVRSILKENYFIVIRRFVLFIK